MRRRPGLRLLAAAGALIVLVAPAGVAPAPAGAESAGAGPGGGGSGAIVGGARSVVATGRAQGLRATYTVPDYVIVSEFFDGGGPVTESVADSTGRATSFSSLPWPGENAVTAPGTASAAMGRSVPLAYPFQVRADYPTAPSAEVHDPSGAYAISAVAQAGRTVAAGAFQGPSAASGSRAQTTAALDDGGVARVVAETADTGLSVGGGLLRIAAVRSRSETTLAPADSRPVTHSQLVVEGAAVAGHAVTIGADGVHAADHTVPAPVGRGASSDNELLGQAGISVAVAPTGRPGSADALVITSRQVIPAPGNPKGTLVLRIGGASSEIVVGSADAPVDGPVAGGDQTASGGPSGGPVAGEGPAVSAAPSDAAGSGGPAVEGGGPAAVRDTDAGEAPGASGSAAAAASSGSGDPAAGAGSEAASVVPAANAAPSGAGLAAAPLRAGVAAGLRPAPVVPDLATTGALFSLLALGATALFLATRLHRYKVTKVRA